MSQRIRVDSFAYRLVAPAVCLEAGLVGVPLIIGIYYSLFRVDYFKRGEFLGIGNYWAVLSSPEVLNSLWVTVVFSVSSLALTFGVGFALALYLEKDTRLNIFIRAVILIPYVISMMVGSLLLKWILVQDSGILPFLLSPFGLADLSILGNTRTAMAALVCNAAWRDSAFAMILLMAGLKSIPHQLYAAARVDGASLFFQFQKITLPLLRVPILITLIRLLIHFANVLTFALVLTGGGPNDATTTIGLTLYKLGFEYYRFGQANALAFLIFLFNIGMILLLIRFFREGTA